MSNVRMRKVMLEPLTHTRFNELAGEFGLEGVSALPKETVVQAIVKSGSDAPGFLVLLARYVLKANRTDLELDSTGHDKQVKDTCKPGGSWRFMCIDIKNWIKQKLASSPERAASKVSNKGD